MNLLRNTRVYLAGAVEHDLNATSWRDLATARLRRMGVYVYDPLVKPSWLDPICKGDPQAYRKVLNGTSSQLTKAEVFFANEELRRICLSMVASADWIICYLPIKFTAGTFEEIYLAGNIGKPVLFITPDGIPSTWVPPIFTTSSKMDETFFPTWDAFWEHLSAFDAGKVDYDKFKWLPISYLPELNPPAPILFNLADVSKTDGTL